MENLVQLIETLRAMPKETEWLEFKGGNFNPDMIGEDISALANSAVIHDKDIAYMIWGISDVSHEYVRTNESFRTCKIGNEELESWLRKLLSKNASFKLESVIIESFEIEVLKIYPPIDRSVSFKKEEYIRIGSYTKRLIEYPEEQAKLWQKLLESKYETKIAMRDVTLDEIFELLDVNTYLELTKRPTNTSKNASLHYLLEEKIISKQDNGLFSISNLGALLLAKNINTFQSISRKTIRLIQYEGVSKNTILRSIDGGKGYAVGFSGLIHYLEALIPSKEVFLDGVRTKQSEIPIIAIRETIANALIHQDLSKTGSGPLIEIFDNRIEITNPGTPIIDIERFIDNPPRSRNENLAAMMRKFKLCEEAGSGWDRIVISCELLHLPAPTIHIYDNDTKVVLYKYKSFNELDIKEKIHACYFHSCIKYVEGSYLTNSSLRERFGVAKTNISSISRLISEAMTEGVIKADNEDTSNKYKKYKPFWA